MLPVMLHRQQCCRAQGVCWVPRRRVPHGTPCPASRGWHASALAPAGQLELAAGGIKVDGTFATSAPDVYAIGDVAAFPLLREGGAVVRQEHVTHARASAAHAVKAALGEPACLRACMGPLWA